MKLGVSQGTAGSVYTTIDFTNISNVTCTLYGYPGVSLQTARPLHQIGKPAKENSATPRKLVTLQPQTTANALLQIVDAGNYPAEHLRPDDRALPAGLPAEPDHARLHQVQDASVLEAGAADDRERGQAPARAVPDRPGGVNAATRPLYGHQVHIHDGHGSTVSGGAGAGGQA